MLPKKIIGIGLPRTGNVTLAACVRQLFEFQTVGWNKQAAEAVVGNDWRTVQEMAAGNRCLTELPWAAIFRKLDTWFPDSKFVLTYRDPHTWIESMTEQIDKIRNPERLVGQNSGDGSSEQRILSGTSNNTHADTCSIYRRSADIFKRVKNY